MIPQSFAVGGNQLCPEFWTVTGNPRYPGYNTLIIAPEPTIERAIENILLMGGKIGIHMLLRALLRDSTVRL
jgi:hypothetical protein